jgi:hypothetical protein
MHMLNSHGHVSIHWEEQNDVHILPVIEKMLAQGYKFFIVGDNNEQVAVTDTTEVATTRRITLSDDSLQQLYDAGLIQVGGITIEDDAETTGEQAKTPEAVAEHETVVTKPASGG